MLTTPFYNTDDFRQSPTLVMLDHDAGLLMLLDEGDGWWLSKSVNGAVGGHMDTINESYLEHFGPWMMMVVGIAMGWKDLGEDMDTMNPLQAHSHHTAEYNLSQVSPSQPCFDHFGDFDFASSL